MTKVLSLRVQMTWLSGLAHSQVRLAIQTLRLCLELVRGFFIFNDTLELPSDNYSYS
jgi:hypothetical protein